MLRFAVDCLSLHARKLGLRNGSGLACSNAFLLFRRGTDKMVYVPPRTAKNSRKAAHEMVAEQFRNYAHYVTTRSRVNLTMPREATARQAAGALQLDIGKAAR